MLYFKLVATPVPHPGLSGLTGVGSSDPDWMSIRVGRGTRTAPSVLSASLSDEAGGNMRWDKGETVEAVLTFDEEVTVDTTNGTPTVGFSLGYDAVSSRGSYVSGSGTRVLTFRYRVGEMEGPYRAARLTANSLALDGGALGSTAWGGAATLEHGSSTMEYPQFVGLPATGLL